MFHIDTIKVVHYSTPLHKKVRVFEISEYCRSVNPLFLVTLDDEFFCSADSATEARQEVYKFCEEEGYIEVI